MLTEEQKEQAIEQVRDCGWAYEHETNRGKGVSYRYTTKGGRICAYIDGCRASVHDSSTGHDLFSREFPEDRLFAAMAKAGRAADEIAATFRQAEGILAGI